MKRSALVTAAGLTLAVLPATPAAAADPVTTLELVSGAAPIGSSDPHTDLSTDGGATWQDATVIPHSVYSTLPGTGWISLADSGYSRPNSTTLFRRDFQLPSGAIGSGVDVCVHTDNAARISLNGTQVGQQTDAEIVPNFRDPAECFVAPGTLLHSGANVLEFAVHNFSGPLGLGYRARITYVERVNTPPVLQLPADLPVDATGPQGAEVHFEVTATDDTGAPEVPCEPASGSMLAVGTTTVTCTATDDDGATTTGSFTVTVRGAADQLADLLAAVTGVSPGRSLAAKVRTAIAGLADLSRPTTCEALADLTAEVRAQSGKHIPADTAGRFLTDAARIRAVLDCR